MYGLISVVIGIIDLHFAGAQERYLAEFPRGDIGTYVKPRKVFGIHNWVFFPSWIVITLWILFVRVINRVFY